MQQPQIRSTWTALAGAAALAASLAGCGGGGSLFGGGPSSPAATATAAAQVPSDIPGRWALTTAGTTCAVNLIGGPTATEGAIRPEGGCPGNLYTSRKWTFENGALIVRDHTGQPLVQLTLLAQGRFEGQTSGGQPASLVR